MAWHKGVVENRQDGRIEGVEYHAGAIGVAMNIGSWRGWNEYERIRKSEECFLYRQLGMTFAQIGQKTGIRPNVVSDMLFNRKFNAERLERELTLAWRCDGVPAVVTEPIERHHR